MEILSRFHLAQIFEEVREAEHKVRKYSEYLGISEGELREVHESLGPWTMHSDYLTDVQWLRDRYLRVLSYLDREQQSKFKELYFLESPTERLLITPTVQSLLGLTEEQKKELSNIYLESRNGKEGAIYEEGESKAKRMIMMLTEQQTWELKHAREKIEYKIARQADPSASVASPLTIFERLIEPVDADNQIARP